VSVNSSYLTGAGEFRPQNSPTSLLDCQIPMPGTSKEQINQVFSSSLNPSPSGQKDLLPTKSFYYIDNNEIQSVKEFIYRLETLWSNKKKEEKGQ